MRLITPPIIRIIVRKIFPSKKTSELFDGESGIFISNVKKSKVYGEYGLGQSTLYVGKEFNIPIFSVDTNAEWLKVIENKISKDTTDRKLIWVDLGLIVGIWGYPEDYSKRENIDDYLNSIWKKQLKPDFVLIDGRFRIASFLTSYINAEKDSVIVFDDYPYRKKYHVIEELLKPIEINNRQALFKIPKEKKLDKAKALLVDFKHVMD